MYDLLTGVKLGDNGEVYRHVFCASQSAFPLIFKAPGDGSAQSGFSCSFSRTQVSSTLPALELHRAHAIAKPPISPL